MIRMKPVLFCSLFATAVVLFAATFAEAGWRHHRQAEPGCAAVEPGCSVVIRFQKCGDILVIYEGF